MRRVRSRRGAVIVAALVMSVILMVIGTALISIASTNTTATAELINRRQAHAAATTGVQKALDRVQYMGDQVANAGPIGTQIAAITADDPVTSWMESAAPPAALTDTSPYRDGVVLDGSCYTYYYRNFNPAGTVEVVVTGVAPAPQGTTCAKDTNSPFSEEFKVTATIQFSSTAGSYALLGSGIYIGS